jgi:hypothetical protein
MILRIIVSIGAEDNPTLTAPFDQGGPNDDRFPCHCPGQEGRADGRLRTGFAIEQVRDPDPAWATANPAAFLAWLWVVQRDCPALRDLLRS